mgnify:CR=1 FL=1
MTMGLDRPKRFYKEVGIAPHEGQFGVILDGKGIRTPMGELVVTPTAQATALLAREWDAQKEEIIIEVMMLNRLVNFTLDKEEELRDEILTQCAKYLETDLLLYHVDAPEALAKRQSERWQPWIDWFNGEFKAKLTAKTDMSVDAVPNDVAGRVAQHIRDLDPYTRTALGRLVGLLGSTILGLAVAAGAIEGEEAYAIARLDEIYQAETWGDDDEAKVIAQGLRLEILALSQFLRALADDLKTDQS